ncbi:ABC transporter permease [Paenibacillus sacheonensis]|uniref:ABC transporter permease subunit n=1 Tax=Paenibacillus sacheonensis TaxID=742054 RepID=A0A7X4YMK5_9BACL|nr:ABC transporter permease [Paenibacillus sacheonensis]NBC69118.1 ABC transporter permease subunit [Paenibacillus sacheonensis]
MVRYLGGKLINIVFSLLILATATFFLMKAVPGDPFTQEKAIPPEIKAQIMAHYGFDKPLGEQYLNYMKKLFQFDLGISMKSSDRSVSSIIAQSFGTSAKVGAMAIVVSVIIGIYLGMMAALRHRKFIDNGAMFLAVIGISVPNFVIGSMIQYFLAVKFPIFHVAGLESPMDYVLPTIALSTLPIAFIARLTRSTMLEVLTSDYIRTAKAKGLTPRAILWQHGLRNGILPVVTYLGPMTANIITGSVVVEQIFGLPGLGAYFVESVTNRDYTLIMGITIFYAVILMAARFVTDVLYIFVDPRIKLSGGVVKS